MPTRTSGDLYFGVGGGMVKHYSATGHLLSVLSTPNDNVDQYGLCFDSAGTLYVMSGNSAFATKFDSHDQPAGLIVGMAQGSIACTVDAANNFYAGIPTELYSPSWLNKYDSSGQFDGVMLFPTNDSVQAIDLAADQCTLVYLGVVIDPSGGLPWRIVSSTIERVNICTQQALPPLGWSLPGPGACGALRLLRNGEVLEACGPHIYRIDPYGQVIRTYTFGSSALMFTLDLDPDGTAFWTYDRNSATAMKVDLASGQVLTSFTVPPADPTYPDVGLAVYGAPRVSLSTPLPTDTAATWDATPTGTPTITPMPTCVADSTSARLVVSPTAGPPSASLTVSYTGCTADWPDYMFTWDGQYFQAGGGGPPPSLTLVPPWYGNTPGCHTIGLIEGYDAQGDLTPPVATTHYLVTGTGATCSTATSTPTTTGSAVPTATTSPTHIPTSIALAGEGTPTLPPPTATPSSTASPTPTPTNSPTATRTSMPTSSVIATALAPETATTVAGVTKMPMPVTATPRVALPTHKHVSSKLPLNLSLSPRTVRSGRTLSVTIRTAPHARVVTTLEVVAAKAVVVGKGKHRKRMMHQVVLYARRMQGNARRMQGTAGAQGRFTRRLIITYKPRKPTWARLSVTARLGHRARTDTVRLLIESPPRHRARTR